MPIIGTLIVASAGSLALAWFAERSAFDDAIRTLGADSIRALLFTASVATFSVGQSFTPTDPRPRVTLERYTALMDLDAGSRRQEFVREMGTTMPRGVGVPFTGELRQIQYSDTQSAWNIPFPQTRPPDRSVRSTTTCSD